MGLETFTYISSFNSANPVSSDNASQGDDHIRGIKAAVLATFPNVTGAVTPTHTELNYVDGVTSAIQTQMDLKSPLAAPTFTGPVKSTGTSGSVWAYGFGGDPDRGVFYANSAGTIYINNTGNVWTCTGAFQSAGLLRGNGGGSGLGAITIGTGAAAGGAAGDLHFRY